MAYKKAIILLFGYGLLALAMWFDYKDVQASFVELVYVISAVTLIFRGLLVALAYIVMSKNVKSNSLRIRRIAYNKLNLKDYSHIVFMFVQLLLFIVAVFFVNSLLIEVALLINTLGHLLSNVFAERIMNKTEAINV